MFLLLSLCSRARAPKYQQQGQTCTSSCWFCLIFSWPRKRNRVSPYYRRRRRRSTWEANVKLKLSLGGKSIDSQLEVSRVLFHFCVCVSVAPWPNTWEFNRERANERVWAKASVWVLQRVTLKWAKQNQQLPRARAHTGVHRAKRHIVGWNRERGHRYTQNWPNCSCLYTAKSNRGPSWYGGSGGKIKEGCLQTRRKVEGGAQA